VVFKADPQTPLHAMLLGEVFEEAGLPAGVVNILPAGPQVSAALVAHPGVDKISFTGSTATGRLVGETCGRLLKDCNLELGGKSAAVLLDDVDLPSALPWLAGTALMNNGEACVLQSRVLAPRSRYAEVCGALGQAAAGMPVGDPFDPAVYIGPLITDRHRERVEGYIARGLGAGAKVAVGGSRPAGLDRGWYVAPTVMIDVDNTMEIAREEIFGPVVSVIPYEDERDAVAIANDTPYGLSGTVWTSDNARGMAVARQIQAGNYGINTFGMDPCAPFGGYKASGVGRELGPEGLDSFLHAKSIHLPPNWPDAAADAA
jgi:betaine-aldehyde dehydrogenase